MKIKICGITEKTEAEYLNEYNVDFAGFVLFFEKSRRNISIEKAKDIMAILTPSIKKVAVVVSPTLEQALQIENAGFDYIQVHGRLCGGIIEKTSIPILRAFNVDNLDEISACAGNARIGGYVFDAAEPGSGKTFDWNVLKKIPRDGKLFMLAGGLDPQNVADAISTVKPDGVDVSSGVEYTGKRGKDKQAIKLFVQNARKIP